uniref:Protein-serine/threonine kinase n=1 Tax=Romanomermis culicivorax TaxID=13658 RepID=A0A915HZI2_ROMCU
MGFLKFGLARREGDRRSSYLFLRKELLVRFAHSLKELELLPEALLRMPSVRIVQEWYQQSFHEILFHENAEITNKNLDDFTSLLKMVLKWNHNVVQTMAEGIIELKETHGVNVVVENSIQYFLDRFHINRISMRMIINQHVLIFGSELPLSPQFIGSIDPACDVMTVVQDAYRNAKMLCERYYKTAPDLFVRTKNAVDKMDRITVVYVPSHLYHICFELFKNSMRATIEHAKNVQNEPKLPDIKVTIVKGKEDLSIKIGDKGGGVPRSIVEVLFNYMYTTAPPPNKDNSSAPLSLNELKIEQIVTGQSAATGKRKYRDCAERISRIVTDYSNQWLQDDHERLI